MAIFRGRRRSDLEGKLERRRMVAVLVLTAVVVEMKTTVVLDLGSCDQIWSAMVVDAGGWAEAKMLIERRCPIWTQQLAAATTTRSGRTRHDEAARTPAMMVVPGRKEKMLPAAISSGSGRIWAVLTASRRRETPPSRSGTAKAEKTSSGDHGRQRRRSTGDRRGEAAELELGLDLGLGFG